MFSYLQKFNELPENIKEAISGSAAVSALSKIEREYGVELASFVMKVAVKEISWNEMETRLSYDFNMDESRARSLSLVLKENIFSRIPNFLGGQVVRPVAAPAISAEEKILENNLKNNNFSVPGENIGDLVKEVESYLSRAKEDGQIEKRLDAALLAVGLNFGSEEAKKRLRQIFKTYFLGIRDRLETKIALAKSLEAGGLSLTEEAAEEALRKGESAVYSNDEPIEKKEIIPEIKKEEFKMPARDIEYNLAASIKQKQEENKEEKKPVKLDLSHELSEPLEKKEKLISAPAVKRELTKTESTPVTPLKIINNIIKKEDVVSPAPKPQENWEKLPSGKKVVRDVRFAPKVSNPIEELAFMNLAAFRRLGQAREAMEKIIGKIKLLEAQSYGKRIEAIKAFRRSPLNMLYLDLGRRASEEGKGVADVIKNSPDSMNSITMDEFEVINDLNRELRF